MMLLELLASRLLAPLIGYSLHTWTSIIGVILAAYALGSWFGGRVADRWRSWRAVCLNLIGIALSLVVCLLLIKQSTWILDLSSAVQLKAVFAAILLCFVPTFLMAMIYPQLLKLEAVELERVGRSIGGIGAWNAVGSILGTLLGGYVFTQYFWSSHVIYAVLFLLTALAFLAWLFTRKSSVEVASRVDDSHVVASGQALSRIPLRLFISGFCLMSLQLISGRIMAPYLGVSIYSWTSVIVATLLGIIAGYEYGGKQADKRLTRELLGGMFFMAGLVFFISIVLAVVLGAMSPIILMHLSVKSFLYAVFVFMSPAFFLSMTTPMLIRFGIRQVQDTAHSYGVLMAWSSLGNVLGVMVTGFVLIPLLGTRFLMILLGLMCFVLGYFTFEKMTRKEWSMLVPAGLFFLIVITFPARCLVESQYFCILINERTETTDDGKGRTVKWLRLDHLIHSFIDLQDPAHLGYGYEQAYASLIAYRYQPTDAFHAVFLGGGGYVMPRYLETFYPRSTSTVIEIDPMVTEINHRELGLSRETRIRSINHDARQAIHRWPEEEKMDLVFGDAFNDFSIPFHLTTIEFHQELKARMAQDGVYALNIIDDAKYGNFLAAMTKTLRSIWKHVYLISGSRDIAPRRNTFILMASDEPLDLTRWLQVETFAAAEFDGKVLNRAEMLSFIPEEDLQTFLDERTVEVLRDELVPTDRYLAPVFSDDH